MASASETRSDLSLPGVWPLKANFLNEMSIYLSAEVTQGHCNMADTVEFALCEPFLKWGGRKQLRHSAEPGLYYAGSGTQESRLFLSCAAVYNLLIKFIC